MRSLTFFLAGVTTARLGRRAKGYLRAIVSALVALSLLLQAFPYPGRPDSQVNPPARSFSPLTNPVKAARYASSFVIPYPEMALAQGGVITKTAPATTEPGDPLSYQIFIQNTK